jgi:homeobox protein cut-like
MVTELKSEMTAQSNFHKETEYALTRQLVNLQSQFEILKSTQDFVTATSTLDVASSDAEREVLVREVERCNEKVSALSLENYSLKDQLQKSLDTCTTTGLLDDYRQQEVTLKSIIEDLKVKLEVTVNSHESVVGDYKSQISSLDRHLANLNTQLAFLKTQLLEYSDYEQVKKELDIFRDMEGGGAGDVPLERIVLERNKKLENENTALKVCILA